MNTTAGRAWLGIGLLVFALLALAAFSATNYPAWWYSRGVIDTNATVNDFAPVVQGQLKWIATNAADELQDNLPGGAGTSVNARLSEFTPSNNYFGVNLGQLKYVGEPFWVRLIEEGYTDAYPWTVTTADDADFAPANIGQLKNVFSFDVAYDSDGDGLPDWWETCYFGGLTNEAAGDWDADGLSNLGEYQASTSPTNTDSDGDTIFDGWEVDYGLDPLAGGSAGVVAWYKLDETSGIVAADSSTNGFQGSITGTTAAAWQWGAVNRSLELDGSDDGIKVADALALRIRSNITMAGWVKLWTTNGIQTVVEKTCSYYLNIKDGRPQFYWYGITNAGYHKAPEVLPTNTWTHVAATYNGQAVIIYVDGVAVMTTNAIGPGAVSSQPLGVGWNPSTKNRYLSGCLDDVRVYGVALSSNDAHGLFELGDDPDEDGVGNLTEYLLGCVPTNSDTDADGLLDGQEVALGTSPIDPDTDGDGVPDGWEVSYGLAPLSSDSARDPDFDGFSNLEEYQAAPQTCPTNPLSAPPGAVYVATNGAPCADGTYSSPVDTLSNALGHVSNGMRIVVMPGVHKGPGNRCVNPQGKQVLFKGAHGPDATVIDCERGGRAFIFGSSQGSATVVDGVTIKHGLAGNGGAIYSGAGASPVVRNCFLVRNEATNTGGGIYCAGGSAVAVKGCAVVRNQAAASGGGVYWGNGAHVHLASCTVVSNGESGLVLGGYPAGTVEIVDCIVWGHDVGEQISGPYTVPATYSCVEGAYGGEPYPGEGNISNEPSVAAYGYRLGVDSSCLDAGTGTNGACEVDIDLESRVEYPGVANPTSPYDMGCDELVDADGDGLADAWEWHYFASLTNAGGEDGDGDGLTTATEYRQGTDPALLDMDGDTLSDSSELAGGTDPTDPDTDADGLWDSAETDTGVYNGPTNTGTDPLLWDTDSDGYGDGQEVGVGTDPNNPLSHPVSISGWVENLGGQSGTVYAILGTASNDWGGAYRTNCSAPGPYLFSGVPNCTQWWVMGFLDSDADNSPDGWEARGAFDDNPLYPTTDVANAHIVLYDPDSDGDGLADWVETDTGVYQGPSDTGTDPELPDSDGDGVTDGAEVLRGTDPNDPDSYLIAVFGTVSYEGAQTGSVVVMAALSDSWTAVQAQTNEVLGTFTVTDLIKGSSYWIRAFMDMNEDGSRAEWEASGTWASSPFTITQDVTNVTLALTDADADSNDVADWWQVAHGYPIHAVAAEPVARYRMDGGRGRQLCLDGVDDFVALHDWSWATNDCFSIGLWLRPASTSGIHGVLGKGSDVEWYVCQDSRDLRFVYADASTADVLSLCAVDVVDTQHWSHVVATYDGEGGVGGLYVDGVCRDTDTSIPVPFADGTGCVWVGCASTSPGSNSWFVGEVDNVTVWGRAVASNETREMFLSGSVVTSDLEHCYLFDAEWDGVAWDAVPLGVHGVYGGGATNEGATLLLDSSGNGYHGLLVGGRSETRPSGFAWVELDGTSDYMVVAHASALMPTDRLTCVTWLLPESLSQYDTVVSKTTGGDWDDGYGVYADSSTSIAVFVSDYSLHSAAAGVPGAIWSHFAGTYDGTNLSAYVNGAVRETVGWTGGVLWSSAALYAGGQNSEWSWRGGLRDLRIYDAGLSELDITSIWVSSDLDCDGLDMASEFAHGTDPASGDTDGDGDEDGLEVAVGSDPTDATSKRIALGGSVYSHGSVTGTLVVLAAVTSNSWGTNISMTIPAPGPYVLTNALSKTTYWVRVFADWDQNGQVTGGEPWGNFKGNPFSANGDATNIDLAIPDEDCDGLPDNWEMELFGSLTNESQSTDTDGDGLNALQEYLAGTDLSLEDSDGDGLTDGQEVLEFGSNPNNAADGAVLLEQARHRIITHWNMIFATPLVLTNSPGSVQDLEDLDAALDMLSGHFHNPVFQ